MLSNFDNKRFASSSYSWEGVMEFLNSEFQNNAQRQNLWAIERNQLQQTIKELQGKLIAIENINKDLIAKNSILEFSLRKMKSRQSQQKSKAENQMGKSNQIDAKMLEEIPKVPQRRPKSNKNDLSKVLSSLGIPELLKDIKQDMELHQKQQNSMTGLSSKGKEFASSLQLKYQTFHANIHSLKNVEARQYSQDLAPELDKASGVSSKLKINYTLEGHQDGVREVCFINGTQELKQIVSVSEDCTLKVWDVTAKHEGKRQIQTVRDHLGPIFTCVEGEGYVFTGGMEGIIRAYDFSESKHNSAQKCSLSMKWRNNVEEKLEPLWQLAYDRINRTLIATSSEMVIKGYKIPEERPTDPSNASKMEPSSLFCYKTSAEDSDEYIPTAICFHHESLVSSYFNSSSIVFYDTETQQIQKEIAYSIDGQLSANKLVSHPKCLLGAYEDCCVRIFDGASLTKQWKAHDEAVMSIALSWSNPNALFTCGQDGYVKLWDMRSIDKGAVWSEITHERKSDEAVHCIQANFDGTLTSGGADGLVKVYSQTCSSLSSAQRIFEIVEILLDRVQAFSHCFSEMIQHAAVKGFKYFKDQSLRNLRVTAIDTLPITQEMETLIKQAFKSLNVGLTYWNRTDIDQSGVNGIDLSIENTKDVTQNQILNAKLKQIGVQTHEVGPIVVPWFPKQERDIDMLGKNLQKVQEEVGKCHIQFTDMSYRRRRDHIAHIADVYKMGDKIPSIDYSEEETELWKRIYKNLKPLHKKSMSSKFLEEMNKMDEKLSVSSKIPQLSELSDYLATRTGYTVKPVPGILDQRQFLNSFAFKIFNSTQYLRNVKTPDYSPEPDIVHEIVGHIPMFADQQVANLSQQIGIISLGASDEEIRKLGALYWFTLEFGACRENSKNLGYGAGIASSVGEIEHFLSKDANFKDFQPEVDCYLDFPTQTVQNLYRVTPSFSSSLKALEIYGKKLSKPFETTYDQKTKTIKFNRQLEAKNFEK